MSEQTTQISVPEQVEYRDIPGFPGYRVGNDGSVWSAWVASRAGRKLRDNYKQMKTAINTSGYPTVTLTVTGAKSSRKVHRLVLLAFVGPCPANQECCHRDGCRTNNALSNLRWDTKKANRADMVRHGSHPHGERTPSNKLAAAQVHEICKRYAAGETQVSLSKEYGVNQPTISNIVTGKLWRYLARI